IDHDGNGIVLGAGSITRTPVQPKLDNGSSSVIAERTYWEVAGVIPQIDLRNIAYWASHGDASPIADPGSGQSETGFAHPLSTSNTAHGSGGALHHDIQPMTEWVARWWLNQDPTQVPYTIAMIEQAANIA